MRGLSRILLAFATSSTLVTARFLPGTLCRTSTNCTQNCLFGTWIKVLDGDTGRDVFACDPDVDDPVTYSTGVCERVGLGATRPLAAACQAAGGTTCRIACLLAVNASVKDGIEATWENACRNAGGGVFFVNPWGSENAVRRVAGCPANK